MASPAPKPTNEFAHRDLPRLHRRVSRIGLAANYGIDEASVRRAFERGINYVFYTLRGSMAGPLRDALKRDRDKIVVSTGPLFAFAGGNVRRGAERTLKALGTDYLDVYQLPWLGKLSAWTDGTLRAFRHLKESGKVRAFGISIHDRERAGRLAQEADLDVMMFRYNAAHPGAERDIFPHLGDARPAMIAYTATSWRRLLKAPSGWTGKVPTAADCYRFCLSNPDVDLVLSGPANETQLDENIAALERGPLSAEEMSWMREFGQAVHG